MIRFQNVTKTYPRTGDALSEISFHLRKGEFAFLTGHSGAGKSTLLDLIHFQTRPSEGEVQVSRYRASRIKRREIPDLRRRVGFVFQDFKLLERLSAAENVAFALEVTGTSRPRIAGKVQRLLTQVGLAAKAKSLPSELSGGERQRVVIARALATDPLILLADEPTGNLDPLAAQGVFDLFRTLNQLGMAVLMATHDTGLVRANPAIRVLELERGRLVFDSVTAPAAVEASAPDTAPDPSIAPPVVAQPRPVAAEPKSKPEREPKPEPADERTEPSSPARGLTAAGGVTEPTPTSHTDGST